MRIPLLLKLRALGYGVGAVGSGSGSAFEQHDIPFHHYELNRWINPMADRRSRKQLRVLFETHRPDVIHAFDTKPAILAPIAAHDAGVPGRIRTVTGAGYVFSSSSPLALALRPIYRRLQQLASKAASCTVFQNPDDQKYFLEHQLVSPATAALVRSSGVDTQEFLAQRPDQQRCEALRKQLNLGDELVVTMIARLVRYKGVVEYMKAARILRERGIRVRFLLAGPLASEGRQAIKRSQIDAYTDEVDYVGICQDVPGLLAVSDLFVLPSYYREGVPRVLLEAGVMSLPLITTDMPGCKEVVHDNENGLLVPPRDAQALADAIAKLLSLDAKQRASMGEESCRHVCENFDLNDVAGAYAEIYDRSLDACGVPC